MEKVHFGSTSMLALEDGSGQDLANSIYPVINLYMMKIDKELDRESQSTYKLDIVLYKKSSSSLDSSASNRLLETKRLTIRVADVNDNEPQFEANSYKFEIVENNPPNVSLGVIRAFDKDLDENGTVEYFLLDSSLVSFNSSGGAENGLFFLNILSVR